MIVCSCNALTHRDVESAVQDGASRPAEVYASRGCRAQCGNCVPGVVCIVRELRKAGMNAAAARGMMPRANEGLIASCH